MRLWRVMVSVSSSCEWRRRNLPGAFESAGRSNDEPRIEHYLPARHGGFANAREQQFGSSPSCFKCRLRDGCQWRTQGHCPGHFIKTHNRYLARDGEMALMDGLQGAQRQQVAS